MNLLVDTHVLLWYVENDRRLSKTAQELIREPDNPLFFSVASIWEIVIKKNRGKLDADLDPVALRRNLLDHDWRELAVTGEHALAVGALPPIHKDPFDRILLAQAQVEALTLLTSDKLVARYPGKVMRV